MGPVGHDDLVMALATALGELPRTGGICWMARRMGAWTDGAGLAFQNVIEIFAKALLFPPTG